MKNIVLLAAVLLISVLVYAQITTTLPEVVTGHPAKVDYAVFEKLTAEAGAHRKKCMVTLDQFLNMSREPGVIILDTRSDSMYQKKHIKGAVHLNFSDFTQENLAKTIPSMITKVLIYCNNNFDDDPIAFASKEVVLPKNPLNGVTLALNIPTFINLYGYGYRNVYELSELVSVFDARVKFEGISVQQR